MKHLHYWIGEGANYICKECKTSLSINLDLIGDKYNKSYTYTYANGDHSTVFTQGIKDLCPVVKWNMGKWLGDAVELLPRPTG